MKPKKDIFDLFRESEPKLTQRPSREAWKRLEDRLDERRNHNKRSSLRILAYAAAVLVLVVSVSLMTTVMQKQSPEAQDLAFEVEDMVVVNVSTENYQHFQQDRLNNPIAEGDTDKKLYPRINTDRRDGNLKKFYEKKIREHKESGATVDKPAHSTTPKDDNPPLADAAASAEVATDLTAEKESIPLQTAPEPIAFEAAEPSYPDAAKTEITQPAEDVSVDNAELSSATLSESGNQDDQAEAFMRGQSLEEYRTSQKAKPAGKIAPTASIDDFQWLLGKWKHNVKGKNVKEKWGKTEADVLEGKGSVILDGQVRLIDDMKIRNIGGTIYFLADFDGDGTTTSYRLISNENNKAVFQNESGEQLRSVVLERKK